MVEVKKRKGEGGLVEEVSPSKKSKKKNSFNVVDLDEEAGEKDFLKLSRSQVVEDEGDGAGKKKKKKNRKSAKNKPAINLAALGGISSTSIVDQEKVDMAEKSTEEKQSPDTVIKSQKAIKENAGKKKTLNEKTEKIREKKKKKKAN